MKRTSIVLAILVTVLFITTATLTAQGTGQGGRPAGASAPQIPTSVQGNRPATAGSNKSASVGNRPETTRKPDSAGPKDAMGFENYNEETEQKRKEMLTKLDEADYISLSSNRLYGSIPRNPRRYPLATRYYQALNNVIDRPEALAADPMLVKRLRRLRSGRQRARAARRLGAEPK